MYIIGNESIIISSLRGECVFYIFRKIILPALLFAVLLLCASCVSSMSNGGGSHSSGGLLSFLGKSIHRAAQAGDIDRIRQLIADKGKDVVNERDKKKNTPLMMAAYKGQIETMKFLIENGAKVNKTNISGQTALTAAAQGKQEEAFAWLVKNYPKLAKRKDGELSTAYMMAAGSGFPVPVFETVSDKLFFAQDAEGGDLLSYAVWGDNLQVVHYYFLRSKRLKKRDMSRLSNAWLANFDRPESKDALEMVAREYCDYVYKHKNYIPDSMVLYMFERSCGYNLRKLAESRNK